MPSEPTAIIKGMQEEKDLNKYMGQNLKRIRKASGYKSATAAVETMINQGCSINYDRYLDLEKGAWPKEIEKRQIPIFFEARLKDWLFGHCPDAPDFCEELMRALSRAPLKTRTLILEMSMKGIQTAAELDLE